MRKEDQDKIEKALIVLAMGGAGLVGYASARGAAEVTDTVYGAVQDVTGNVGDTMLKSPNPVVKGLAGILGAGKKGGVL